VGEAGLEDLHPRHLQPLLHLGLQLLGDLLGVAPQGLALGVIGVAARQGPDGRLRLDGHEGLVVLHLEEGLGRVHHPEDHHRGDLNGVAVGVVYFELVRGEVVDPQGDALSRRQGVGEVEARLPHRAHVPPQKHQDHGLVGLDREEARP
jgi:hypothetical protein